MRGYKVVSVEYNRYFSASIFAKTTEYTLNKETKRKEGNGPLAVFGSQKAAIRFVKKALNYGKVFRCDYIPSRDKELWWTEDGITNRWDDELPESTRFAESVTLLEEVFDYKDED